MTEISQDLRRTRDDRDHPRLGVGERWSHHIWPLHVHDVLNLTQQARNVADM